ncbi:MAG: T9SS type A sorting domain-containing protein [Bacteroidota bacterium]|nr:T9SS type A sorting domain-containing protein [Bacteroidota bacterium]
MQFVFPRNCDGQWKKLLDGGDFGAIYFLNNQGHPEIGFAASAFYTWTQPILYKTTDGGTTWKGLYNGDLGTTAQQFDIRDIVFKDSLIGWLADGYGIFKTTNGGDKWQRIGNGNLPDPFLCGSVAFDSSSGGLFTNAHGTQYQFTSWDEGTTWTHVMDDYHAGYEFANGNLGVATSQYAGFAPGTTHWSRTTDGGHNWRSIAMDSECWQPLAVKGTGTQFAITDLSAAVFVSDDAWDTWREVPFPQKEATPDAFHVMSTGCIRGDFCHLFVQIKKGCYLSTDQGNTWRYTGGPVSQPLIFGRRSWVNGSKIFMASTDSTGLNFPPFTYHLWMLNLDSLEVANVQLSVNGVRIRGGDTVRLDAGLSQLVPGYDTISFRMRYDTMSSELVQIQSSPNWLLFDSSSSEGYLRLVFKRRDSTMDGHIAQLFFRTLVSENTSAQFVLDSIHFIGPPTRAGCATLALGGGDSVTIAIQGCGDNTLRQLMADSILFRIVSVVPNPAQSEVAVTFAGEAGSSIEYRLYDALGTERLRGECSNDLALDVAPLPSGIYYLRCSSNGNAQTRTLSIER